MQPEEQTNVGAMTTTLWYYWRIQCPSQLCKHCEWQKQICSVLSSFRIMVNVSQQTSVSHRWILDRFRETILMYSIQLTIWNREEMVTWIWPPLMAVYQQAIALQSTPDCNVVQFHRRGMFRAVSAARPQMNIEKKKKIFNHQRIWIWRCRKHSPPIHQIGQ